MNLWAKTKGLLSNETSDEILTFQGVQVKVVRRRIRRLILRAESFGVARLICPPRFPLKGLEEFLQDRSEWLKKQNLEMSKWAPWKNRCGQEGEPYLFLGDELKLKDGITVLKKPFLAITPAEAPYLYYYWPEHLLSLRHHSRAQVFAEIENFFEKKAETILLERAAVISDQMALKPKRIRFRSQRGRWGSCSSRGHISLNRRLIGAPTWVIDSVLVHEFAHLLYLNHSKAFWEVVRKYSNDHERTDQWLKENQFKLLAR